MTAACDTDQLGTLPALRKLGRLADLRPVIIIDSREQTPLPIMRLETVRDGLQSGDYSFQGAEPDTTPLTVDPAIWTAFLNSPESDRYSSLKTQPIPKTEADIRASVIDDWKTFKRHHR